MKKGRECAIVRDERRRLFESQPPVGFKVLSRLRLTPKEAKVVAKASSISRFLEPTCRDSK